MGEYSFVYAQTVAPEWGEGRVLDPAAVRAQADSAIASEIGSLNPAMREIFAAQLRLQLMPFMRAELRHEGDFLVARLDETTLRSRADGSMASVRGAAGRRIRLTQHRTSSTYTIVRRADQGVRTDTIRRTSEGLRVEVTFRAPLLRAPIAYSYAMVPASADVGSGAAAATAATAATDGGDAEDSSPSAATPPAP